MRVADKIELDSRTKRQLQSLLVCENAGARVRQRASAILLAAQGWQNKDIALEIHADRGQVAVWRRCFIAGGVQALTPEVVRSPRTMKLSAADQSRILSATLEDRPATATHWSTRTLATHLGMRPATIERFWRRNGLKPHLQRTFQLAPGSRVDPDKVELAGLFLHPAKKAIVLSCDEKGLGRKTTCKESGLPLQRGRALTMANYYQRNGTLQPFAALNSLADRPVALEHLPLPLADWLTFLELIDDKTPQGLRLYLIEDSSYDRVPGDLQEWLLKHTRLVLHSTPTPKSWLRIVELFYRELCERCVPPGGIDLERAIKRYVAARDEDPSAIIWSPKGVASCGQIDKHRSRPSPEAMGRPRRQIR